MVILVNFGVKRPGDFACHESDGCGVGRAFEFNIEREFDIVAFNLTVELVEDVAELHIPAVAFGLLLTDADFCGIARSAHLNRISSAAACPPGVERIVGRCVVDLLTLNLSNKRCIVGYHKCARVVGVAVAPLLEYAAVVRCYGQCCGIALCVVSGAGNCTILGCCVNKQLAGAEVLLNNLAVDSNLHILEVECSAFVSLFVELIEVYSNSNVIGPFFSNCTAPRYVSPAFIGYLISSILDSVEVSIVINKLGIFIIGIAVTISRLAGYHHYLSLIGAAKTVPVDIKIELEFAACLLSVEA